MHSLFMEAAKEWRGTVIIIYFFSAILFTYIYIYIRRKKNHAYPKISDAIFWYWISGIYFLEMYTIDVSFYTAIYLVTTLENIFFGLMPIVLSITYSLAFLISVCNLILLYPRALRRTGFFLVGFPLILIVFMLPFFSGLARMGGMEDALLPNTENSPAMVVLIGCAYSFFWLIYFRCSSKIKRLFKNNI